MSAMTLRLPPLNALRAFEAAGRHVSFTRAADELHVTQAAVSHQIKLLEEHLGRPLFRRFVRRLELTEEGAVLLPVASAAFGQIAAATDVLRAADETVTVTLRPYFAMKWLAPRLGRFWERHPDIGLKLHHSTALPDFARGDSDLGVVWSKGGWSGLDSDVLQPGELTPVCGADLPRRRGALDKPADLVPQLILREETDDDWLDWLRIAGDPPIDIRRGTIIDDTNVRIEAAMDGQGVALGWVPLLANELAGGRLIRPFDVAVTDYAYHIVYPPGALSRPKVKAFRDWLLDEAAADGNEP